MGETPESSTPHTTQTGLRPGVFFLHCLHGYYSNVSEGVKKLPPGLFCRGRLPAGGQGFIRPVSGFDKTCPERSQRIKPLHGGLHMPKRQTGFFHTFSIARGTCHSCGSLPMPKRLRAGRQESSLKDSHAGFLPLSGMGMTLASLFSDN